MLQQILRDMWVDPEILAELDDTQKQTLFCKMREEQVRRWRLWDQKLINENSEKRSGQRKRSTTKKSVQFLQGENGEPWVWVMGEHADDRSIEDILLEEAKRKAQQQAQIEAEQLRKSVERELTHYIDDYKPLDTFNQEINISPKQDTEESMEIYCTVDELRQRIQELEPDLKLGESEERNNNSCLSLGKITGYNNNNERNLNMELAKNTLNFNFIEGKRDVLQELSIGGGGGESVVGSRVAAWERRVASTRAGEILRGLRERRAAQAREAEKAEIQQNTLWREQERRAKEAEHQIREIARRAREEHRRSSAPDHDSEPTESRYTDADADTSLTCAIGKPGSREAVVEWFREKELARGAGLDENKKPADWFHGVITRSEAESVLQECPPGSYLVRVSERIWGYAISYRASQRCKHYLVDASRDSHYQFLGDNQKTHRTLGDLVKYHSENAITESGQEKLVLPCLVQADQSSVQRLCS